MCLSQGDESPQSRTPGGCRTRPTRYRDSRAEIVTVIENGGFQPSLIDRLNELERQKRESEACLKDSSEDLPDMHPANAETYRTKIERLTQALADPDTLPEALRQSDRWSAGSFSRREPTGGTSRPFAAILELMVERKKSLTPGWGVRLQWLRG